nr:HNH endonuclease [Nakamurella lactea]
MSRARSKVRQPRAAHAAAAAGTPAGMTLVDDPLIGSSMFDVAVESSPVSHGVGLRVLLLNATHEPLAVVTGRRALVLLLAGKAECVAERDGHPQVHSPTLVITIPAVVRLNRYVRVPYQPATSITRAGILRRDRRTCAYCGNRADTIDHVQPRSRGGLHSWENCVACCSRCNTRKADRLLGELGWSLPFAPGPPARAGGGRVWLTDDTDPAWSPWLVGAA